MGINYRLYRVNAIRSGKWYVTADKNEEIKAWTSLLMYGDDCTFWNTYLCISVLCSYLLHPDCKHVILRVKWYFSVLICLIMSITYAYLSYSLKWLDINLCWYYNTCHIRTPNAILCWYTGFDPEIRLR